jgi:hypothetical protein
MTDGSIAWRAGAGRAVVPPHGCNDQRRLATRVVHLRQATYLQRRGSGVRRLSDAWVPRRRWSTDACIVGHGHQR